MRTSAVCAVLLFVLGMAGLELSDSIVRIVTKLAALLHFHRALHCHLNCGSTPMSVHAVIVWKANEVNKRRTNAPSL